MPDGGFSWRPIDLRARVLPFPFFEWVNLLVESPIELAGYFGICVAGGFCLFSSNLFSSVFSSLPSELSFFLGFLFGTVE